jgi:hypothetical protein
MADTEVTKKTDGKRARKTSARHKEPGKRSAVSRRLKELWADPVWREKQMVHLRRATLAGQAKRGRFGVPDGMRKEEADAKWAEAKESAKQTMAELKKAGVFEGDDQRAEEALQSAIEVMRSPMKQENRIAAARLVLEYTKSKPASNTNVTVNKAEEWLAAIAEQNDEGKTSEDA